MHSMNLQICPEVLSMCFTNEVRAALSYDCQSYGQVPYDEGSCKYVDQVAQRGFHLRPCARPGHFDHLNDSCISIIWSGPSPNAS